MMNQTTFLRNLCWKITRMVMSGFFFMIFQGLYPESHGIIDNNMYDYSIGSLFGMGKKNASDPRWWGGEPVSEADDLMYP